MKKGWGKGTGGKQRQEDGSGGKSSAQQQGRLPMPPHPTVVRLALRSELLTEAWTNAASYLVVHFHALLPLR